MIKVTVMQTIDFDVLNDKSHTSISGGIATHSFEKVAEIKAETYEQALKDITVNYGTPFIFDDRLELQVNDSESLSFYLEEVIVKPMNNSKLKKTFSNLEEY